MHPAGVGQATVDFISVHIRWHHGDARVRWTQLGRRTQWLISLQEHSTHPKPQLGAGMWWMRPGRGLQQVTTQVPGSSTTPLIHAATTTLSLAHSTPQPCTRSGMNTTKKGTWPCAVTGQNCGSLHRWHIGWPHRPHLFQQSPPLGQGMNSRAIEPYWTQPSGLLLQTLGE